MAITEKIPILIVKKAFNNPNIIETKRAIKTASATAKSKSLINFAVNTAEKLITAPVDRSNSPAIIS